MTFLTPAVPRIGTRSHAASMYFSSRPRSSSNNWCANSSGIRSSQCAVACHSYGPEDQPLALLSQVVADVGIAQQRQARLATFDEGRDVFGDQVLVGQRDDRQVLADHRGHFAAAVARRVDDRLRLDHALRRVHTPFARGSAFDRGDPRVAMNLRAGVARALGQRLRQLRRVDVAVVRIVQSGENVVGRRRTDGARRTSRGLSICEFDALRTRLRDDVPEFVDAVARVREPHAARHVIVDVVADRSAERRRTASCCDAAA